MAPPPPLPLTRTGTFGFVLRNQSPPIRAVPSPELGSFRSHDGHPHSRHDHPALGSFCRITRSWTKPDKGGQSRTSFRRLLLWWPPFVSFRVLVSCRITRTSSVSEKNAPPYIRSRCAMRHPSAQRPGRNLCSSTGRGVKKSSPPRFLPLRPVRRRPSGRAIAHLCSRESSSRSNDECGLPRQWR